MVQFQGGRSWAHPNPEVLHTPGMVYAILSRDTDFVEKLSVLLRAANGEVYATSSWDEYARIQQEGVVWRCAWWTRCSG
jgi:hypothetical protein